MAIHRSDRNTAFTEFERWMSVVYTMTSDRMRSAPARYKKFFDARIFARVSRAYTETILANEANAKTEQGRTRRTALLTDAVRQLCKIQAPMLGYCNVMQSSEGGAQQWADAINKELRLLYAVLKREDVPPMIITLPKKDKIKRLAFISVMLSLHKYTYQKIGHAPNVCKDSISVKIAEFADEALCGVVLANRKQPATKDEARERETNLQSAIDNLNAMQRPLLALWNIVDYSEDTMDEWAGLLNEELKILEGLKKADKERYKALR